MGTTNNIEFTRGLIFKRNGTIYQVAFTLGKHMALNHWDYINRLKRWSYSMAQHPCFIISAFEGYANKGEIEVLEELPEEVMK